MIKTISYWSFQNGLANTHPIADALKEAKDTGYKGLELCIGTDGVLSHTTTQAECEAIRKLIDASGITVQTLGCGYTWGFNPASEDPAIRKKAIDLHAAALQRAAWLGIDSMLYVPAVVKSPISSDIVRYDRVIERLNVAVKQLLEVAEKVKVELCLENVWNGLFYSPLEMIQFIDQYKSKYWGVYFDVGNVLGYHQHPPHWIELLGNRIKRVHIKDYKEAQGGLGAFCDLGAGNVPWKCSIEALRKIGYNKTVVAEMIPWDQTVLARTSVAMDKILAL